MSAQRPRTLFEALGDVPDHRGRRGNRHPLRAILAMTVAAMLDGNRSLAAIAQWGRDRYATHREWMRRLGFRSYTTPTVSTLHLVFRHINIQAVEDVLGRWISGLLDGDPLRAISLDGKNLRGSARPNVEAPGVHLVSAYLQSPGCVLSQVRVDAKTNEHKAAFELISHLILDHAVIVGDAMFCQRDLSQAILDGGGDYFFAVKDNQPTLHQDIAEAFAEPSSPLGTPRVAS